MIIPIADAQRSAAPAGAELDAGGRPPPPGRSTIDEGLAGEQCRFDESCLERLEAAGCVAADEEGEELLRAAPTDELLETWLRQRERGEPLAWILGRTDFGGHSIR